MTPKLQHTQSVPCTYQLDHMIITLQFIFKMEFNLSKHLSLTVKENTKKMTYGGREGSKHL